VKAPEVIALGPSGPSAPDDVAVVEDGSSDLMDLDDNDVSLDIEGGEPGSIEDEQTATSAAKTSPGDEEPMEIVDDLEVLAEAVAVEEADLEGIEIEANGDPAEPAELMTGAESLFDHGADLSRYHHDDE
jgi:hypothetical protein